MARFCTNCGKELDDNAAMCLNCGVLVGSNTTNNVNNTKKENKKGLPTWAIVLIVVGSIILLPIILIIVFAVTVFNAVKDTGFDINDYVEETIVKRGTIGDSLKTDTFELTLTSALMYSSIGESYYVETPAEGKEFLVFFFEVKNVSDESEYISSYDFSGYVDGYTNSVKYMFNDIDGVEELGTDLAPGMKTNGYVAFEVDQNWQEFEIHFDDWFEDEELVFAVVNETNSNVSGA